MRVCLVSYFPTVNYLHNSLPGLERIIVNSLCNDVLENFAAMRSLLLKTRYLSIEAVIVPRKAEMS